MKIYTEIVLDIETGTVLSSTSEDYAGPVDLLMGTPAIGDLGGGLGLEGGGGGSWRGSARARRPRRFGR